MKLSSNNLPSNKKFGFFFSFIFFTGAIYFFYSSNLNIGYLLVALSLLFFVITLINADLLINLNKLWMSFGLILGKIINPVVLGVIFFGVLTPYGIIMSLVGRDELRLKRIKNDSYWKLRSNYSPQTDFKKQF